MASSTDELTLVRDNLIYLWQGLGFLINIEKSVLQTNEKIELLGMDRLSRNYFEASKGIKRPDCRPVSNSFGDTINYHKGIDPTDRACLPEPLQFSKHISSTVQFRGN